MNRQTGDTCIRKIISINGCNLFGVGRSGCHPDVFLPETCRSGRDRRDSLSFGSLSFRKPQIIFLVRPFFVSALWAFSQFYDNNSYRRITILQYRSNRFFHFSTAYLPCPGPPGRVSRDASLFAGVLFMGRHDYIGASVNHHRTLSAYCWI